jgi:hypothetical protein
LEVAAVQLGHKRMTTTDEHYNNRDSEDTIRPAELLAEAFVPDKLPPTSELPPTQVN